MSITQKIRECFLQASTNRIYQNKWFGDDAWRQILEKHFKLSDILKKNVTRAISNTDLCLPLSLKKFRKQINGEDGNVVQAHFYFIVNETTTKEQLESVDDWEYIYYNYRLPRVSNKKRKTNESKC